MSKQKLWVQLLLGTLSIGAWVSNACATDSNPLPHIILNNDLSNYSLFTKQVIYDVSVPNSIPLAQIATGAQTAFHDSLDYGNFPGIDAQSLCINAGTKNWWQSQLYTADDHKKFLASLGNYLPLANNGGKERYLNSARVYMENGGDFADDFLNHYQTSQKKILNFRLNDHHYHWFYNYLNKAGEHACQNANQPSAIEGWSQMTLTGYFGAFESGVLPDNLDGKAEGGLVLTKQSIAKDCTPNGSNLGCLIEVDKGDEGCALIVLDFSKWSVRLFKRMQIREIVRKYKPAYFEIDITRFPKHFRDDLPYPKRIEIMTAWLKELHNDLLRMQQSEHFSTKLGLRVPHLKDHRSYLGISLTAINEGQLADYVILASSYMAGQQYENELAGTNAKLKYYYEMTNQANVYPMAGGLSRAPVTGATSQSYFTYPTTALQMITAANIAYRDGAQGVALFNTAYYRSMGYGQPPLDIPHKAILCMADPHCAATSDQEYFLTPVHHDLPMEPNLLPFNFSPGKRTANFPMRLLSPDSGWKNSGLLRITVGKSEWTPKVPDSANLGNTFSNLKISFNGKPPLKLLTGNHPDWPTSPLDEPSTAVYLNKMIFSDAGLDAYFAVPTDQLVNGMNSVVMSFNGNDSFRVQNFELFLPANR